jgi:hypothetical protein
VKDRAVPGHWEGDLIFGKKMTSIGTLVERHSRYVILLKLPNGHGAESVRKAMTKRILTLPAQLRRSITWDQGKEMAEHVRLTVETGVQIYFCDPKSPLAAREQREHQQLAPPIPAEGIRPLAVQPTRARRRRPLAQHEASTDAWLDDTISGVRRGCCVDPLRTHRAGDTQHPDTISPADHHANAFFVAPGQCFRFVSGRGGKKDQPTFAQHP